jgi:hypothetical protein
LEKLKSLILIYFAKENYNNNNYFEKYITKFLFYISYLVIVVASVAINNLKEIDLDLLNSFFVYLDFFSFVKISENMQETLNILK